MNCKFSPLFYLLYVFSLINLQSMLCSLKTSITYNKLDCGALPSAFIISFLFYGEQFHNMSSP